MKIAIAFLFCAGVLSWGAVAASHDGSAADVPVVTVAAPVKPVALNDMAIAFDARFKRLEHANAELQTEVERLAREVAELKRQEARH